MRSRAGFRTFAFAARLLEASYEGSRHDPRRAEAMARLALGILGSLDPARYSETAVADLSAQAWSLIGYSLGLRKRWARAEQAFRMAEQMLRTPESVEAGAFCRLLAGVRRGQKRYVEALSLTERAARLFEDAGDARGEQAATELGGELYFALGEMEKGLAHIARARLLLEPGVYNASVVRTRLGLALSYLELDHFAEAEALLAEEAEEDAIPTPLRLQGRIARARAAIALGREQDAEALLAAARSQAEAEGALDEAWLATLDLASLYLGAGRQEKIASLLSRMQRFEAILAPEPREAVARLRRAATRGEVPAKLLEEVAAVLTRFYSGGRDDLLVALFRQYRALFREAETEAPELQLEGS